MCRVFAAALPVHLQGSAEDKTQSSSSKILSYEAGRSALKFEAQRVHNKKKYIQRTLKFTYITSLAASAGACHLDHSDTVPSHSSVLVVGAAP